MLRTITNTKNYKGDVPPLVSKLLTRSRYLVPFRYSWAALLPKPHCYGNLLSILQLTEYHQCVVNLHENEQKQARMGIPVFRKKRHAPSSIGTLYGQPSV